MHEKTPRILSRVYCVCPSNFYGFSPGIKETSGILRMFLLVSSSFYSDFRVSLLVNRIKS